MILYCCTANKLFDLGELNSLVNLKEKQMKARIHSNWCLHGLLSGVINGSIQKSVDPRDKEQIKV